MLVKLKLNINLGIISTCNGYIIGVDKRLFGRDVY